MKKYKKKELIEIITTLIEANEYIARTVYNNEVMIDMLTQCQDAAVNVGNYIETCGNINETLIRELEEYCENIYRLSLVLVDEYRKKKLIKRIQKQLVSIRNIIRYELAEDKKEVVFLPYKASMWDSMESVWKATSEDEDYITYVVPIPYFDKNPDGTFGQLHYEGEQYPDYVPITSWEEYIISERRPDIIYIHNPYDQYNYVTSIHPNFFAVHLRKYTDMLVYIPYFVAIDDKVAEHFCVMPGIFYAHKVIVQSEKVREIYIKTLQKYEEENGCRGVFGKIEEKIIAIGSPKYDKIINLKKEDFKIPEEWERLTIRTDGCRKKVVLYNTTVDQMLKKGRKMIEKIRSTFIRFEKEKELVLIWRPHPLLKSTLKSMYPELLKEYESIENEYKEKGFGIYDTSVELHRAIAYSDIYYGDWSSVTELYKNTGKPILIQNCDIQEDMLQETKLIFECISSYEEGYFATSMEYNGLFIIDKHEKATFISTIPGEKIWKKHLYAASAIYKDYLILAPCTADRICIYNIKTKEFVFKEVKNMFLQKKIDIDGKFLGVHIYKDHIYLLPQKYPYIIKMTPITWEIEYIVVSVDGETLNFKKGYSIKDNVIVMPSILEHIFLELDMDKDQVKKRYINNKSDGAWSICNNGYEYWMVLYPSSQIAYLDINSESVEVITSYPIQLENNGYGFAMSFISGQNYYACPVKSNMMIKVNMYTKEVVQVKVNGLLKKNTTLMYLDRIEDKYIFYRYENGETIWDKKGDYIILDITNLTVRKVNIEIENIDKLKGTVLTQVLGEKYFFIEKSYSDIRLLCEKDNEQSNSDEIGMNGLNIYRKIKDMI